MSNWGRVILNAMINGLSDRNGETELVKMFRIEYSREYRDMVKYGSEINDDTVRYYLANR